MIIFDDKGKKKYLFFTLISNFPTQGTAEVGTLVALVPALVLRYTFGLD